MSVFKEGYGEEEDLEELFLRVHVVELELELLLMQQLWNKVKNEP